MTYALVSALCMAILLMAWALASQPDAVAQEHTARVSAEATVTAEAVYLPTPRPTSRFVCGYYYGC